VHAQHQRHAWHDRRDEQLRGYQRKAPHPPEVRGTHHDQYLYQNEETGGYAESTNWSYDTGTDGLMDGEVEDPGKLEKGKRFSSNTTSREI
jgi:hypothetical protein